MQTPSIARRFVGVGLGVVAALALALDVLVFFSVRNAVAGTGPAGSESLSRVLVLEAIVTPLVLALAALLLRWIAEVATRPLDQIAIRARLTTLGLQGERLRPDRPSTRLGQMASAYDAMLDSLEGAVAEAKAARAESERLERRTRMILDTAHEAFLVMDRTGVVIDVNPEAERMFGWPREEILGRCWEGTLVPSDVRAQLGAHRQGDAGELWPFGNRTVELEAVHRDGHRFPVGVSVWATEHDGSCTFNALIRDLTERQQAEQANAHLRAIVESSDQAMLSTEADGTVLTWNPAAERTYGYTAAEAVGRSLRDLIIPEDHLDRYDDALAAVARGEVTRHDEVIRRRKDGSLLPVSVTIAPLLNADGEIYGACSVARDITSQREIASQLERSLTALAAAAEEARHAEVRTRRFLDDAAHQLRSPITSIRACAETLSLDVTPEQRERLLAAVCRESERAGRLMAGLLRMARLGHEQELALRPTDLVELCEEVADQARLERPELDIRVRTGAGRLAGAVVAPEALGEILSNLVENGRRHARSFIDIRLQPVLDGIELRVVDDGPGIAPGDVEGVFERFVSLDGKGGSGLGLAIGRELARAHGGDLTFEDGAFLLRIRCEFESPVERIPTGGEERRGSLARQRI